MQAPKTKAEISQHKAKLANSYSELLTQFSSPDLSHVGNYALGKLIGEGSFGKVYLARHTLIANSRVVLKASSKSDANLAREIHHHRQFIHPHIARLYEVIITESQVWLVLEYCQGDELYNYLCRKGSLPVDKVQKIFSQLVAAVAYIHSKSCVHRDLKLENVLLDKAENVKLVDFGFTREYEGKASYLQTWCGTICYSAPEMLRGEKYAGEKVDVWSLGIILYALLKGELPFDEDDDAATKAKILKEEPNYPDTWPEAAKTLISKLLSKRPFPRPSLADVLADPFLVDHAPQQQAILKLSQPAPFTTTLEKHTLERMKAAGVDIDKVIENVLSQRCDGLAGWWALLIEKESRKEAKRDKKRKERDAEMKMLRRLSGASGRFSTLATLEQVDEEGSTTTKLEPGRRSTSRGRSQRRSTPQILVSDLPKLPEGVTIESPSPINAPGKGAITPPPPPPIDKDSSRSRSTSRPPLPPKERRRRSSHMQFVSSNPDPLTTPSMNGVMKRPTKRRNNQLFNQLSALKHWFVENTKRGKSPGTTNSSSSLTDKSPNGSSTTMRPISSHLHSPSPLAKETRPSHEREISGTSTQATPRSSYGNALTLVNSNPPRVDTSTARNIRPSNHRDSLSPSPLTPRSSIYRRSSSGTKPTTGLRGRKSTSSSVSSIRSMPRHPTHSHSKASSISSNSLDTIHSPGSSARGGVGRSPHTSIKVLPATPVDGKFNSSGRMVRATATSLSSTPNSSIPNSATSGPGGGFEAGFAHTNSMNMATGNDAKHGSGGMNRFNEAAIALGAPNGVLFAKRKKTPFKGPMLNSSLFGNSSSGAAPIGSPAVGNGLGVGMRSSSDGRLNLGLRDLARRARGGVSASAAAGVGNDINGSPGAIGNGKEQRRKSNIIEEEEEEDYEDVAPNWAGAVRGRRKSHVVLEEEEEDEDEDDAIEEVDEFSDVEVNLRRGERVSSVVVYDDPDPDPVSPGLEREHELDHASAATRSAERSRSRGEVHDNHDLNDEGTLKGAGKSNVDLSAVDGRLSALTEQ